MLIDYSDAAEKTARGEIANLVGMKADEIYSHMPEIRDELERCLAEKTTIRHEMPYTSQTAGESTHLAVKYAFVPRDPELLGDAVQFCVGLPLAVYIQSHLRKDLQV